MRPLSRLVSQAKRAAFNAGTLLAQRRNNEIKKDLGRDIKLAADYLSEKVLVKELRVNSIPILSEEAGVLSTGIEKGDGLRWIVDPLDGSYNYYRRIPLCCVSVALWVEDTPLVGVVYDFNRGEMFHGVVGRGAWLNGVRVRPSSVSRVADSTLMTGFPVDGDFRRSGLAQVVEFAGRFKKVRMMGTAALSLAYVACGRAEVYHEEGIKLWDVAAGLALVAASGGRFIDSPLKNKSYGRRVSATNGRVSLS